MIYSFVNATAEHHLLTLPITFLNKRDNITHQYLEESIAGMYRQFNSFSTSVNMYTRKYFHNVLWCRKMTLDFCTVQYLQKNAKEHFRFYTINVQCLKMFRDLTNISQTCFIFCIEVDIHYLNNQSQPKCATNEVFTFLHQHTHWWIRKLSLLLLFLLLLYRLQLSLMKLLI